MPAARDINFPRVGRRHRGGGAGHDSGQPPLLKKLPIFLFRFPAPTSRYLVGSFD